MYQLTNENFLMYAIKNYDNPSCSGLREFNDDLKRIRYIKRLLGRFQVSGEIKERLVINHLVVLYNVFGVEAANNMLFFKVQEKLWPELKTFLVFLNYMPERISYKGHIVLGTDIPLNDDIVNILRTV